MLRVLLIFISLIIFQSCSTMGPLSSGDIEENMEKLDKIWGKCNNPNRNFTKTERKICESQVMAAGPDGEVGEGINLTDLLDRAKGQRTVVYGGAAVNTSLWNGSLTVLDNYSLNTVDSQGGFISTDWILKEEDPNQRCLIKVNITSQELISNGVRVKILCEIKKLDQWYANNVLYLDEEKKITLKILEVANQIEATNKTS